MSSLPFTLVHTFAYIRFHTDQRMSLSHRTPVASKPPEGLVNFAPSAAITTSSLGSFHGVQTEPSSVVDGTSTPWVSASAGKFISLLIPRSP